MFDAPQTALAAVSQIGKALMPLASRLSAIHPILAEPPSLIKAVMEALEGWHASDRGKPGQGQETLHGPCPPPAFAHTAAELQQHVDGLGADRVAAVLGLTLDHLAPLLAGRVASIKASLRRLRRASSAGTD
jgi:hypothetical protein